jgi:hypothetical protein
MPTNLPEVILASLPGIVVALLTYWLTIRHEAILATRAAANELALLRFEYASNRAALAAFWQSINDLANVPRPENAPTFEGLAHLVSNGLLGQLPPRWTFTRWESISAPALSRLAEKDLAELDQIHRSLREISDLFAQLITLSPEERAILDRERFWPNWYRDMRQGTFDRLSALVTAVLAARDPFA